MLEAVRSRLGSKVCAPNLNQKNINDFKDQQPQVDVDASFMPPAKRHFRETKEWKRKRARIISKIRVMGKFQLQFLLSRMPVSSFCLFSNGSKAEEQRKKEHLANGISD